MNRPPATRKRCERCRRMALVGELVRWCPWCGQLNVWWCGPLDVGRVVTNRPAWTPPHPAHIRKLAAIAGRRGHTSPRHAPGVARHEAY